MRWWSLLLVSCSLLAFAACPDEDPTKYERLAMQQSEGSHCVEADSCGDLLAVYCDPETDGPIVYFDRTTDEVVATCGGACQIPENNCAETCPPAGWTCD